jgi:hypothetical protein
LSSSKGSHQSPNDPCDNIIRVKTSLRFTVDSFFNWKLKTDSKWSAKVGGTIQHESSPSPTTTSWFYLIRKIVLCISFNYFDSIKCLCWISHVLLALYVLFHRTINLESLLTDSLLVSSLL